MQALNHSTNVTGSNVTASRQPTAQQRAAVVRIQRQQTAVSSKCQAAATTSSSSNNNTTTAVAGAAAMAAAVVLQSCCLVAPQAALAAMPTAASSSNSEQQQWQHRQQPAVAAASWQPVMGDMSFGPAAAAAPAPDVEEEEDLQAIEDDIMAQVAIPPELTNFMDMIQKGPIKSAAKLSAARKAVGFDRTVDGRVLLYSDDGEPFQVKNDMGVPGALLLRDAGGYMYYIPSPDEDSLVQIDLSDDAVVAQLFANHAWEELIEPLEGLAPAPEASSSSSRQGQQQQQQQPEGRLEQLRLTERDFRSVVSLLRGAQELPEEPLEELDAREAGIWGGR